MSAIYDEPRVEHEPATPDPPYTPPPSRPPNPRRRSHRGRVVATSLAAVLVVGLAGLALESVPPGTPGHQLWTSIAGSGPPAGPSVAAAAPQADPQLAAIQQVIQRGNAEQTQAITTQNPHGHE